MQNDPPASGSRHTWPLLGLAASLFLGGCLAGQPESECDLFCEGVVNCVTQRPMRDISICPANGGREAAHALCVSECTNLAATMTPQEVDEAVECLHCLDEVLPERTCLRDPTTDGSMPTPGSFYYAVTVTCRYECGVQEGAVYFHQEFARRFTEAAPGPETCDL
ncbi:MAG: hypothetical protein KC619_24440 [Myxococcales bacterium]|nr:hypothetical protein [Myxococcales bacterium]